MKTVNMASLSIVPVDYLASITLKDAYFIFIFYFVTPECKGAIKEVSSRSNEFLSNMFLVPRKTGDMRPVVNFKPQNRFV